MKKLIRRLMFTVAYRFPSFRFLHWIDIITDDELDAQRKANIYLSDLRKSYPNARIYGGPMKSNSFL